MTNTKTTTTKTTHYFRAVLTVLAMLAATLLASGVALAATATFGNPSPIQIVDSAATVDPANLLKSGVTYKAVVTTGARDLAGNPLDQNPNKAGNQSKVWKFTVKK
jgi:hypothetical protein